MRSLRFLIFVGFLFWIFETASADIIYVPGDSSTIQSAINGTTNGDTVLVADGTYFERINYLGKSILVASHIINDSDTMHIQNTIIDADTSVISVADTASVVRFVSGEGVSSILKGFTIKNGIGTISGGSDRYGGGIYIDNSSPLVKDCIIDSNSNIAVYCNTVSGNSSITLGNCDISNNTGSGLGTPVGSGLDWTKIRLNNCSVSGNSGGGFNGSDEIIIDSSSFGVGQHINITNIGSGNVSVCSTTSSQFYRSDLILFSLSGIVRLFVSESYLDSLNISIATSFSLDLIDDSLSNVNISTNDFGGTNIIDSYLYNSHINAHNYWDFNIDGCLLVEGTIFAWGNAIIDGFNITNSTGINAEIRGNSFALLLLENVLIYADNLPIFFGQFGNVDISCSDFYNFGIAWLDSLSYTSLDTSNVYFEDPQFCGPLNENPYTIASTSICAPANNACSTLIGAFGVGCNPTIPTLSEWGMLILALLLLALGTVAVVKRFKTDQYLGKID